jgi:hypothetical protein
VVFGEDSSEVEAIEIMTGADNAGESAIAFYADIGVGK